MGSEADGPLPGSRAPVRILDDPYSPSQVGIVVIDLPAMYGAKAQEERRKGARIAKDFSLKFKFGPNAREQEVITEALTISGFVKSNKLSISNVFWARVRSASYFTTLKPWQKINHFPASKSLRFKNKLALTIRKIKKTLPEEYKGAYDFLPDTYILPKESKRFERKRKCNPKQMWILKPFARCKGRGIRVLSHDTEVKEEGVVCQYVMNPLLITKRKVDLRLYVLVTCYDPLRVYLYHEGLVRFATSEYNTNPEKFSNIFVHLTNFSVNRHNKDYQPNTEKHPGFKWSLSSLMQELTSRGFDHKKTWKDIQEVVVKTIIAHEQQVVSRIKEYGLSRSNCFEIMGFDILLDQDLKPWLLEVNTSCSLTRHCPLDVKVKTKMTCDALNCAGIPAFDATAELKRGDLIFGDEKRAETKSKRREESGDIKMESLGAEELEILRETHLENLRRGGFERLYPTPQNCKKFSRFFQERRRANVLVEKWMRLSEENRMQIIRKNDI
ncbi:hypothetical protein AAMO2058_001034900 [Amorphochlora amoebiformis]